MITSTLSDNYISTVFVAHISGMSSLCASMSLDISQTRIFTDIYLVIINHNRQAILNLLCDLCLHPWERATS